MTTSNPTKLTPASLPSGESAAVNMISAAGANAASEAIKQKSRKQLLMLRIIP